jgi:hypothetical protein
MQFRAVTPNDVKPGDKIRVKCPDGTAADIVIPVGVKPGIVLLFDVPVDRLKNPQKILDFMQEDSSTAGSMGFLSRNVYGVKDVVLAVTIGCAIAYWTVIGFFAGVLYATRDMLIATKVA